MATTVSNVDVTKTSAFIDRVNEQLEVLYGQLNSTSLPNFGGDMLLCSPDGIIATTVAHRVLGKFQRPNPLVADELHKQCVEQWLAQEEIFSHFSWDAVPLKSKSVLYRARELMRSWLVDFKVDRDVIEFTPGETLVSNRGKVSMFQKIRNKDAWTVTHDAFEDFARLVYNTRWLKKTAKTFLQPLTPRLQAMAYNRFKGEKHVGYAIFRHRFLNEVVTLVHGGRFASVEKNNEKRRAIIVAPLGNMLLQRTVSKPLRCILKSLGNDLETGQDVHCERIAHAGVATVDFSNASDSNLLQVVAAQFPSNVSTLLRRYRDPMVLVGEDYVIPHKLSSMGCGFTFEVMTLLLLSIARVLDPSATVYGDDVIINDDVAVQFTEVMGDIMWKVNSKKTFINSAFRESCGAFYLDGHGYITCFDFHWCENINDAVIAVNKLKMITDSNVPVIGGLFRSSYEVLVGCVPALLVGPSNSPLVDPDIGYVVVDKAHRLQKRSSACQKLWKRFEPRLVELAERFQWDLSDACIVSVPKFVNKQASKTDRVTQDTARVAFYLYNGRLTDDKIRFEGEWRSSLYLVTKYGTVGLNSTVLELGRWKKLYARECVRLLLLHSVFCFSLSRGRVVTDRSWYLHTNL